MNQKPSRLTRRDKMLGWLSLLMGTAWLSMGCSPSMLGMLMSPFVDDKIQPRCKLAKDKEVLVAVVCSFAGPVTKPDLMGADRELCERLVLEMSKSFKSNKEKVKFVSPSLVHSYCTNMSSRGVVSDHEIGKKFKADYVLSIDINAMDLYEYRSSQLYRGQANLNVRVLDMTKAADEGVIFDNAYPVTYPAQGPVDAGNSRPADFRAKFLDRISRDLSHWFSAYPSEDRFMMD